MPIFRAIIGPFRRLLGLEPGPLVSTAASTDTPFPDGEDEATDATADVADTCDGQASVKDEWAELQGFIARCEAKAIDLAGLDIDNPVTFWTRWLRAVAV